MSTGVEKKWRKERLLEMKGRYEIWEEGRRGWRQVEKGELETGKIGV